MLGSDALVPAITIVFVAMGCAAGLAMSVSAVTTYPAPAEEKLSNDFTVTAGGRSRKYRMKVDEPEPGRVLTESDSDSSLVTRFEVTPKEGGVSLVQISSTWQGASGVGGFFERTFAPRALRSIYEDELSRLDSYAREQNSS